jgi:hypothetical protein
MDEKNPNQQPTNERYSSWRANIGFSKISDQWHVYFGAISFPMAISCTTRLL